MRVCAKLRGRWALVQDYVGRRAVDIWILRVPAGALNPRLVDEVIGRKALAAAAEQFIEETGSVKSQCRSW